MTDTGGTWIRGSKTELIEDGGNLQIMDDDWSVTKMLKGNLRRIRRRDKHRKNLIDDDYQRRLRVRQLQLRDKEGGVGSLCITMATTRG